MLLGMSPQLGVFKSSLLSLVSDSVSCWSATLEASGDSPSICPPALLDRNPDCILVSWVWLNPTLMDAGILRSDSVDERLCSVALSLSLCLTVSQIKTKVNKQ